MPLEFSMRVPNMAGFTTALHQIPIKDWSEAWPKIIRKLKGIMQGQFVSQGERGPRGGWKELSPEYAKRKDRKYPGAPILTARGDLFDSLVSESGDTIDERRPEKLRWGSRLPYALYHQTGTKKMPARPIFDLRQPEDRQALERVFNTTAANIFRRKGYRVARMAEFGEIGPGFARQLGEAAMGGRPVAGFSVPLSGGI